MRLATWSDKERIEEICNAPALRVWTSFPGAPRCDASRYLKAPSFSVVGDEGCFLGLSLAEGRLVVHTNLLPHCRGAAALRAAREALRIAFIQTHAQELVTMVPRSIPQAMWLAKAMGFRYQFTRPQLWPAGDQRHDTDFMSLSIDDWVMQGHCQDAGEWLHRQLHLHVPVAHTKDAAHDNYVGAAVEMVRAGNVDKAVAVYNRWARFAMYECVRVVSRDPLRLDIRDAVVRVDGDQFEVEACHA